MTPQEERLVLEFHAKWGNRWSKIARKLPGRTDNEIKNYWRTHMRKKAQEKKRCKSSSSSSSNCCSSSITTTTLDSIQSPDSGKACFYDTGGSDSIALYGGRNEDIEEFEAGYSMDDIWKEIDMSDDKIMKSVTTVYPGVGSYFYNPSITSPAWECTLDSIWKMDADENTMSLPSDPFPRAWAFGQASLTG